MRIKILIVVTCLSDIMKVNIALLTKLNQINKFKVIQDVDLNYEKKTSKWFELILGTLRIFFIDSNFPF